MDAAFRQLLRQGFTLVEAPGGWGSGTQAEELGLTGQGTIAPGALADLVVLDPQPAGGRHLRGRGSRLASGLGAAA